jgi:hypothetical protein
MIGTPFPSFPEVMHEVSLTQLTPLSDPNPVPSVGAASTTPGIMGESNVS